MWSERDTPLVSIITPSYQQGKFLQRTLESVAGQTYPQIEHIVMDGGSTDGSVDLLRAFAASQPHGRFQWVSEPDQGQADAINKGLGRTNGRILAYLNSDDLYAPDAVEKAVTYLLQHPDVYLVHGRGCHIDVHDQRLDPYPSKPCDYAGLGTYCFICQPTAFWRREASDAIGTFDTTLQYGLDYDYWIRLSKRFALGFLEAELAYTRLHQDAKTVGQREAMHREILRVVKHHYGRVSYHWIYAAANAKSWMERLRSGNRWVRWVYPPVFGAASAVLYILWNRRLPVRMLQHVRPGIARVGKAQIFE